MNIEIPPQSYIAQQYLTAVFPKKALSYSETRNMPTINMDDHPNKKIAVLCPWQTPKLATEFDLLINSASFQEMEPTLVANYAKLLQPLVRNHVYIRALPNGMPEAKNPGESGVMEKVTRDHYIRFFNQFRLDKENKAIILPDIQEIDVPYRDMFFQRMTKEKNSPS